MSEQKTLKELLKEKLRAFALAKIETGEKEIALIDITILDETLKEYHKKGFIFSDIFDKNESEIIRWVNLREIVNDRRKELRGLKETLKDYKKTLKIYGGKSYFKLRTPFYKEQIDKLNKEIPIKEPRLNKLLVEYKPLNRKIKALKKLSCEKIGEKIGVIKG